MKKLMKKEKGITLIALVVTIIVLLILAGISIMMLTGQSGILNQARAAKEDTRGGEVKDEVALAVSENTMAEYTGSGTRKSRQEVIDQLHKEGKLTDDEVTWLEEHNQITIGSIEIDFSSLGETTERLEDIYYLQGDYNDETKKIENIELFFLPELWARIKSENPEAFKMTEEELVLKDRGHAETFEEYMQEVYDSTKINKKYTTAKEFLMSGYTKSYDGDLTTEEKYEKHIEMLKRWFGESLTEEELVVLRARRIMKTNANTFDEYMEKLYNTKKYETAKEFVLNNYEYYSYIDTDREYDEFIQELKLEYEITIENSSGNIMNIWNSVVPINQQGEYEFTIKVDGEGVKKLTVNIDQYEIIYANGSIENENYEYNYIYGIVAYDFTKEKILAIDSGEYNYYSDYGKEDSKTLTNEDITNIEGIGSFIEIPYPKTTYKYNLKSNNITIEGYHYEGSWEESE